ncbi:MAG TPA: hypothetical protein VFA65_13985 [Bryobacteraceae bacterium]|nr:hypothetical protein [Bryobacteraceae bacterium]
MRIRIVDVAADRRGLSVLHLHYNSASVEALLAVALDPTLTTVA